MALRQVAYPATGSNMSTPIEFDKPELTIDSKWEVRSTERDINDGNYFYLVSEKVYANANKTAPILVCKSTDPYGTLFASAEQAYRMLLDFHTYHNIDFPYWNELLTLATQDKDWFAAAGYVRGILGSTNTGSRRLELE